jgi:hypothetical protein
MPCFSGETGYLFSQNAGWDKKSKIRAEPEPRRVVRRDT